MKKASHHIRNVLKSLLMQFVGFGVLFYLVPIPALIASNSDFEYLTNVLLLMNPAVVFGLNVIYSMRNKFRWYVPLIGAAMFFPGMFIFYNMTAMPYVIIYTAIGYIGAAAGISISKDNDKTDI